MARVLVRGCILKNLGDSANVELVQAMTGANVQIVNNKYDCGDAIRYTVMGSVLGWADSKTVVWGTGKMSDTDSTMFKEKPLEIRAVRGKLTRQELIKRGIDCPEVYGDPFILMPDLYDYSVQKSYLLGIITHHIDKDKIPWLQNKFPGANIIDIQDDVHKVIMEINKCENIASSALHGIICADSLGIPAVWLKLSDKVLGNGFKFQDYASSCSRETIEPILFNESLRTEHILKELTEFKKVTHNKNMLYDSCPWRIT